jgi:glycosyltransferase 2 family protein
MKRPSAPVLRALRTFGGVAILAVVIWRVGTGPFLTGLRAITIWPVLAATGLAAVSTAAMAWRWRVVARGLGVDMTMRAAVAAYYRSQFLNTVLPGGVLGDVDRAMRQGREVNEVTLGLRAVAWERTAGQFVQLALTVVVLVVFPSPVHSALLIVAGILAGASCVIAALHLAGARLRLASARAWLEVGAASVVAVGCHVCVFLIAAHTAGSTTSLARMLPLAMIVLLASGLPTSVGGWGPREGVAAWLFAAAGLGAAQGIATATIYGVMVFASCLPGSVLLVAGFARRRRAGPPQLPAAASAAVQPVHIWNSSERRVSV